MTDDQLPGAKPRLGQKKSIDSAQANTELEQLELFVADIFDVAVKGDIQSMESPIFALSTKTDLQKWIYKYGDFRLEVTPSVDGRPTIFDKDLLMFCISQVVEGGNRGRQVSRRVSFTGHQFLLATGRGTSGKDYEAMLAAIKRLRGVTITFDGETAKKNKLGKVQGLIDSAEIEASSINHSTNIEITLSEWIYEAIENKKVLTYHPNYFRLRKPNERRLYELCRKFCGTQPIWTIGLEKLYARFGTRSSYKEWKRMLKNVMSLQSLPEYTTELDDSRDILVVSYTPKRKPPLNELTQ